MKIRFRHILSLLLIGLPAMLLTSRPVEAQFIRVTMEVESELSTQTLQPLSFGQLYQNTGPVSVGMGAENMGIFSISGSPIQKVRVSLQSPELLRHADRSLNDSLEVSIQAAYANRGANRVEDARPFNDEQAQFQMMENTGNLTSAALLRDVTAYIYIFGNLSVGDVEPGLYDGDVVIEVEYY